jgi:hypothetical protein
MTNTPSSQAIAAIAPAAPGKEVVSRRKPGRPRVVRRAPDHDEFRYIQAQREARRKLIENDTLLHALETRADATDVVREVVVRLAEETAALRYDREQAEADGFVVAEKISARRIDGLSKLAGVVTEARRLGVLGEVDPRSHQFRKVERFFVDTIAEALRETVPSETGKLVIDRLMAAMSKWRESVESAGEDHIP